MKPSFCSNCCRVTTDLELDDGFWWCDRCRNDRPVARGPARGYEVLEREIPRGHVPSWRPPVMRTARYVGKTASPGFVLERVARKYSGGVRSAAEARETLRGNSWFAEVRHLGSDRQFHIFERPDVDAAKRAREETRYAVMAALEKAAVRK